MTTSHVQKLADAKCPECNGDGAFYLSWDLTDPPGQETKCSTCHGNGTLVPGLRRECLWTSYYIKHGSDSRCTTRGGCEVCDGRGWTLTPKVEQMGVLVRAAKTEVIRLYEGNGWGATIGAKEQGYKPCDTPEEALAHAIYQSLIII